MQNYLGEMGKDGQEGDGQVTNREIKTKEVNKQQRIRWIGEVENAISVNCLGGSGNE